MKWYLIRHGQSKFNAGLTDAFNSSMTEKGLDQACRAGLTMKEICEMQKVDFIGLVSPYYRCLQTAMHIKAYTGLKFKVTPLLGESPEEIHKDVDQIIDKDTNFPFDWSEFGESYNYHETKDEYIARIKRFVESLDDKNYVIVSHMSPIRAMLKMLCDIDVQISNCSISLIENRKIIYAGKPC
jgi:broad specificity phosphatase PhoE